MKGTGSITTGLTADIIHFFGTAKCWHLSATIIFTHADLLYYSCNSRSKPNWLWLIL